MRRVLIIIGCCVTVFHTTLCACIDSLIVSQSHISRTARRAGETEKQDASALAPAHVPTPETGSTNTASPGSNTGKRDEIKATATRTGAAAGPRRSPRIKNGVDTDEGAGQGREQWSLDCIQHE